MGLFLSMSGIIGADSSSVQKVLTEIALDNEGVFELYEGTTNQPNIGVITTEVNNTSILYPDGFVKWDEYSAAISKKLNVPVFSFHIHDGDLWMYILFQNGIEQDWFNPVPEYWEAIDKNEKEKWKGNAELICSIIPNIKKTVIEKYFKVWDLEKEENEKAYVDDEFTYGDCWQMCDFMNKIGIVYPMDASGNVIGNTYRLWTKDLN